MRTSRLAKIGKSQKGSAIIIVMGLIAMLTAAAIMSVDRSNTDLELSYNQLHEEMAFYLAEAGLERAVFEINEDNDWRDGYDKLALEGGYYTINITDSTVDSALVDTVILNGEGIYNTTKTEMESWLVPEYTYPYRYGMFGGDSLKFDRNGCVDSYNSDSGTYAATRDTLNGDIGTNGKIITSTNVIIGGDAYTAEGGSITLGGGSKVLGDTSTTQDSVKLDIIPQTEYDWAKSVSNAPGGLSGTGYTYNPGTKTLTTGSSGNVVLQSGVYYFSSITLGKLTNITLAPGANVTIYLKDNFQLGQQCNINAFGDPGAFEVFSQNGSLNFNQNSRYYGTFYGPNGTIQFDQTTQVFGSMVGKSIKLDQGACFHYDRNLSRSKGRKTGDMLVVAWRQLD